MSHEIESDPMVLDWEWSAAEIQRVGYQVVDLIASYLTQLPERPVWQPYPDELVAALQHTLPPEAGQTSDALLQEFASQIAPYPFGNGNPRFYAWVNSPPTVIGVFAEALAAAMNPSCAGGNHAAIYIERQVIRWFVQLIGLPETTMGLLVSGGSMATLTALAVARDMCGAGQMRTQGLQQDGQRLVLYRSEQGHSCIQKATEMLGLGSVNLRNIPVDAHYRMQVAALEQAIQDDLQSGYRPMAVVASAGTTNTGAIDPLAQIAAVCRRHGVWLHVDGAYGAPAILTAAYADELAALRLADSVALDPHKWFSVPYEAGMILVRDGPALRNTFSLVPEYLRIDGAASGVSGPPWYSEYGFQQTRGFQSLKLWMSLKYHGFAGYRQAIEHDLQLAQHLASCIAASPDLELAAPPCLSVVCFRYAPAHLPADTEQLNLLNKQLLERLQLSGEAFLAGTTLADRFVLRACIVNFRASRTDIDSLVALIQDIGAEIIAQA